MRFLPLSLLMACSRPAPLPPAPVEAAEPSVVLFVRHAEKERDGTRDPALTSEGEARAACLATLLTSFAPDRLLTTEYTRTQATLQPLAAALGKETETFPAGDDQRWMAMLRTLAPGSRTIVAGHSNTVPAMVRALGGELKGLDADGYIPDDTFDRLVHVTLVDGAAQSVYTTAYCTTPTPPPVDPTE